jgi:hypothetical protein
MVQYKIYVATGGIAWNVDSSFRSSSQY